MPKTCRTDTFMSGIPTGSSILVMAAVVIHPPGSRAFPKPDLAGGCGWVLQTSLADGTGSQKPAHNAKFRCFFIEICMERGFGRAALQIRAAFPRAGSKPGRVLEHPLMALSPPDPTYGTSLV